MAFINCMEAQQNILLLGMVYSTENRPIAGQEYRDRVRINALEMLGYNVYTLDDKNGEMHQKTVAGKHCSSSFCMKNFLKKDMEAVWGKDIAFDYIILDYFWCHEGWLQDRWTEAFFDTSLPFFLNFGFLKYRGKIFLPWKRGVQKIVDDVGVKLTCAYDLQPVSNPNENPLYAATDLCESDLLKCKKDKCRTNKSEMPELFKDAPFLKLTRRKRYLPLPDDDSSESSSDEDEMEEEDQDDDGSVDSWGHPKPRKFAGVVTVKKTILWSVCGGLKDEKCWHHIRSFLCSENDLKYPSEMCKNLSRFRWHSFYGEMQYLLSGPSSHPTSLKTIEN